MKYFSGIALAVALAISANAQPIINPDPVQPTITGITNNPAYANALATLADTNAPGQLFPASAATLTAPMVLTNDYFFLNSDQAEVTNGGKAVFNFTTTNAGDYVLESLVNAPDESSNSFFLNIDAMPDDAMIWDVEVTTNFEQRVADWRGNGSDSASDEFAPKRFTLTPGAHQIIIVGREPGTELKSITIRPAPPQPAAVPASAATP
jgi:hypothetical protein